MDKLKIIKIIVFVLTFFMVFVSCLILTKITLKSEQEADFYTINLEESSSVAGFTTLSDGQRLYVTTKDKIHIINTGDGRYEGVVILKEQERKNGQKEQK